jgi:hypothetical protein
MACTGSRRTDCFYPFLNSALDGDEWSTSGPGHFTAKKQHLYLLNREQGGPQSRSERYGEEEEEEEQTCSCRNSNSRWSSPSPARYMTSYYAIPCNFFHLTCLQLITLTKPEKRVQVQMRRNRIDG